MTTRPNTHRRFTVSSSWLMTEMDPTRREALLERVRSGSLTAYRTIAGGDEFYGAWLVLVDVYLRRTLGVSHADLADYAWRTDYRAGVSPRAAAEEALARDDAGWLLGL